MSSTYNISHNSPIQPSLVASSINAMKSRVLSIDPWCTSTPISNSSEFPSAVLTFKFVQLYSAHHQINSSSWYFFSSQYPLYQLSWYSIKCFLLICKCIVYIFLLSLEFCFICFTINIASVVDVPF
ncbi:unnamed protein product [Meganyctiphanes norvegica]|uniref:Uncharacterized protein n=1 Tax=Meganyctiphanes norvegica TaxID=48144 RepID=A0AAV2QKN3_MEGNR